jgi:hypothetical protein
MLAKIHDAWKPACPEALLFGEPCWDGGFCMLKIIFAFNEK